MKLTQFLIPTLFVSCLVFMQRGTAEPGRHGDNGRGGRFRHNGKTQIEAFTHWGKTRNEVTEALTGFDKLTNGADRQGPPFESLTKNNVVALRSFNDNRFIFEDVETAADEVGPTYNAQSCRECHQNVVTGGASQVVEQRAGRIDSQQFFESLGGSPS
ncbi:MAG: thiol oxidoreductase-like protein [Chthoniobacteraceae bacterium]|nr:thiol oxidoreductase-like protein [Chthoniobacteraceae bacterium]